MSIQIKNVKVFGISDSLIRAGYPMRTGEPITLLDDASVQVTERDWSRIDKLSSVKVGTGHDTALKGIIVQFDIRYPEFWSPQLQRYNFVDIISSQSKMHSIAKKPLEQDDFYMPISEYTIGRLNKLIEAGDLETVMNELPSGYMKWMALSASYLSLKTIYSQRKHHKLAFWREFCQWIETLPHSYLITKKKKEDDSTSI